MTEQQYPKELVIRRGPDSGKFPDTPPPMVRQELKLVPLTDPVLHERCAPAPTGQRFKQENESLIECMLSVCDKKNGYGLSANQLGVSRQLFVLYMQGEKDFAFFNPSIIEMCSSENELEEGCLSLPYILHKVKRPNWIIISWFDIEGFEKRATYHGMSARVICHEMDHLNGKTLFDYMSPFEARRAKERQSKMLKVAQRRKKGT